MEVHATEDKKRRRHRREEPSEQLAYEVEKALREHGERIDPAEKANAEDALRELRSALESADVARIQAAESRLSTAWQTIAAKLHQSGTRRG
jgi:molecular chaperone DnaK